MLPRRRSEPFDDPTWLFEIKHDGFRALAYMADGRCRLRARDGHRFGDFRPLEKALAAALRGRDVILDGEIVCLDGKGRSVFADLIHRRTTPYFYAFDLLWLHGEDYRSRPLIERKQELARLIERRKGRLLYVDHIVGHGRSLYTEACEWDLEGILAKRKTSQYVMGKTGAWLTIKNAEYSQGKARRGPTEGWR
jgi:bifunctional non-homologous end joining protein LigD